MTATEKMHAVVVSNEEWLQARRALLKQEKALTRQRDELARKRRELPWVKVEKDYVFDGPNGSVTLGDLFADRSQLMIYHFMFGPDWAEGCPSCSMVADNIDGALVHLAQRDATLVMVSRAPIGKIEAFKKRMGWKAPWVSSNRNSFNWDFHVSFTKDEMNKGEVFYNFGMNRFPSDEAPGASVFFKDEAGAIFHTYSTFARGAEALIGTYNLLDMVPKGRDEADLPFTMSWVRHHDRYPEAESAHSAGACCHSTEHS
ncbi:MAG TPA: thioredoxin family protein [Candidatus Solibacter sp.]|nr:thioredoxin family protein [Candidatus Solibacter sp.]